MTPSRGRDARVERGGRLVALAILVLVASAAQLLLMQRDGEAMQSTRLGSARQVLSAANRTPAAPAPAPRPWQLASTAPTRPAPARVSESAPQRASLSSYEATVSAPVREGETRATMTRREAVDVPADDLSASSGVAADDPVTATAEDAVEPVSRPGYQAAGAPLTGSPERVEPPVQDDPAPVPEADSPAGEAPQVGPADPGAWLDRDTGGMQLMVLGPVTARKGDTVSFPIMVDGAQGIAHAPVRVQYDPAVLEFVGAQEGPFLSTDGAGTEFIAQPTAIPGEVQIALSRMPPARGISGSGTLCTLTFVAREAGDTPIVTAGSRLLDASGRVVEFRRNDSHVAIQ